MNENIYFFILIIIITIITLFLERSYPMFKALYSHVNNIIEEYLQIYNHILLYLQWVKKEKIKTKATIKPYS